MDNTVKSKQRQSFGILALTFVTGMMMAERNAIAEPEPAVDNMAKGLKQAVHAHPRVSPDGYHIIYTSDATGYGNIYRVDLKPFDQLPDWPLPERK